ncbi:hypothetical protein IED13_00965 [Bosea sp. SSUT16]|uniref:Chromosomal replication initiator DnaA C-terminal domain-containing protein n=1 Tax=Bosea spartocytisi TaxID=2773451 RepID=A0A927E8K8_9HYPH|nr:helix-turn-helix domain-containing protein [Bosea spartocytisi]MBD3844249.1 hypothetical protein [Bosea spartocytisi]MCT4470643.1 hypothetical protein [Bosea spartocytisi]
MSLVPALAEAHAARIERLKRMGALPLPQAVVIPTGPSRLETGGVPHLAGRRRNGMLWEEQEIEILLSMAADRFSARAIGTKLRRSSNAVMSKARSLGVVLYMRPSREFFSPARGEEITALYKLVVNQEKSNKTRIRGIINMCADKYGVLPTDILGQGRSEVVVLARQQAIWLAANETGLSLMELGRQFMRDHTTVIHSIRRENDRTGKNVRGLGGRKR